MSGIARKKWPCGCILSTVIVEYDPLWKESTLEECGLAGDGCQRFTAKPENLPSACPNEIREQKPDNRGKQKPDD